VFLLRLYKKAFLHISIIFYFYYIVVYANCTYYPYYYPYHYPNYDVIYLHGFLPQAQKPFVFLCFLAYSFT